MGDGHAMDPVEHGIEHAVQAGEGLEIVAERRESAATAGFAGLGGRVPASLSPFGTAAPHLAFGRL